MVLVVVNRCLDHVPCDAYGMHCAVFISSWLKSPSWMKTRPVEHSENSGSILEPAR